jgi:GTP cyclohydrolase FolE2
MAKKDYSDLSKEELIELVDKLESKKKYGLVWDEERVPEKVVMVAKFMEDLIKELPEEDFC